MSQLPSGTYLPGTSLLHRLDPRVKLLSLLLLLAAVLLTADLLGYLLLFAFAAMLIALSGSGAKLVLQPVWRLKWVFLILFLMNLCFYSPEGAWLHWWIFTPSPGGLVQGGNILLRVLLLLTVSNLLTLTTAPMALTGAIEDLLQPLRYVGLPTDQIAMILSVAIQFVPTLLEEANTIRKAQMARGARFDSDKLLDKAKAVLPLLIPIFLAAFKRADELALAMEARGYRGHGRVRRRKAPTPLKKTDFGALLLCLLLCAVAYIL